MGGVGSGATCPGHQDPFRPAWEAGRALAEPVPCTAGLDRVVLLPHEAHKMADRRRAVPLRATLFPFRPIAAPPNASPAGVHRKEEQFPHQTWGAGIPSLGERVGLMS